MTSFSIKQKVLLLAILPLTIISIVFFALFISKQINDINISLDNKGNSIAKHIASVSEYAIFSGNLTLLTPLLESALEEEGIISITITNQLGSTLIRLPTESNTIYNNKHSQKTTSNNHIFNKPVVQHTISVDDFGGEAPTMPEVLGWVIVETSDETTLKRKRETIYNTLSITITILLISIFLAIRTSQRITTPIGTLIKTVQEIESGNLDVTFDSQSSGEILELERGISTMIHSLKSSRQDLNTQIQRATNSLRESLKLVEQQNTELKTARQDALSASHAKSDFLTNISHELRTPMNGILGFSRLLKKTQLSREQQKYIETIEESANKLLQLISDILDIPQTEAGKPSIQGINFNLRTCIEDVITLMTPAAHEKEIEIIYLHYNDTPTDIFGPSDRIRQICINLIGNAIKFSEHDNITVRSMLEMQNGDNITIKISVTDQGPGISFNDQQYLFSGFSKPETRGTPKHDGTGLGLAISKSLAEAMQGDIGVKSHQGEGATFWFTFKCQSTNPAEIFVEQQEPFNGISIYIYDSNNIALLAYKHMLKKAGFDVYDFNNFSQLLQALKNNNYCHLCILGLSTNEEQPNESKDILSRISELTSASILLITHQIDPDTLNQLRLQGADACIQKPIHQTALIQALNELLEQTKFKIRDKETINKDIASDETTSNTSSQLNLNGLRILIAEDNPINANLVKTILQRAGASTTNVNNGRKAVEKFLGYTFDIIIMDIHMPIMNGIDATRNIRKSGSKNSAVPILGLTANILSKDQEEFITAGMDEILIKPVLMDELVYKIYYWSHIHDSNQNISQMNYQKLNRLNQTGKKQPFPDPKSNTIKRSSSAASLGVNPELAMELRKMLADGLPKVIEQLKHSFSEQEWKSLRTQIHRLLGGTSYCDVPEFRSSIQKFQTSLHKQTDDLEKNFQIMLKEANKLISETSVANNRGV